MTLQCAGRENANARRIRSYSSFRAAMFDSRQLPTLETVTCSYLQKKVYEAADHF